MNICIFTYCKYTLNQVALQEVAAPRALIVTGNSLVCLQINAVIHNEMGVVPLASAAVSTVVALLVKIMSQKPEDALQYLCSIYSTVDLGWAIVAMAATAFAHVDWRDMLECVVFIQLVRAGDLTAADKFLVMLMKMVHEDVFETVATIIARRDPGYIAYYLFVVEPQPIALACTMTLIVHVLLQRIATCQTLSMIFGLGQFGSHLCKCIILDQFSMQACIESLITAVIALLVQVKHPMKLTLLLGMITWRSYYYRWRSIVAMELGFDLPFPIVIIDEGGDRVF